MIDIYVIYENPEDYPSWRFVLRVHRITGRGETRKVTATDKVWVGNRFCDVTRHIPKSKQRMDRSEIDEKQILEWWY